MARVVRFDRYGGVEVLHLVPAEVPVPGSQQLLISVRAAGINPFDTKVRTGLMEGRFPVDFPAPQGTDVAGVVEQVGPDVTDFKPGDEIVASTGRRGAQADFALVPVKNALPKPVNVSWEIAGALWVVATTGAAMVNSVKAGAGDTVLVSGASGGVGVIATQLARHRGATVIGVASESNHDWLRARGVIPIAYGDGLQERIALALEQAGGGLDALLDIAGGGYVDLGVELGVDPARIDTIVDYEAAERLGAKAEGGAAAGAGEVAEVLGLIAAGELEVPIHRVFPLADVQAAYTELEQGHPRGKIVLMP